MNQRARNIIILALLAILGVVAFQAFFHREPVYHQKRLSLWLEEGLTNYWGCPQAEEALRAIGPAAVPTLLDMVQVKDSPTRGLLRELTRDQKWIPVHFEKADEVRKRAGYGFGQLGSMAKSGVPGLIRLLEADDPNVRASAAWCLGKIGPVSPEAIPALIRYLDAAVARNTGAKEDAIERFDATVALGRMGPSARAASPQLLILVRATNELNGLVAVSARAALIQFGEQPIQPLVEALKDTSHTTSWIYAASTLDFCGTNGAPAIPALVAALGQTNTDIQNRAIRLLGTIHSHPEFCLLPVTPFLQSTNSMTRFFSLNTIRAFGPGAREWAPETEIIRCLNDPDLWVRQQATNALQTIDPEAAAKAGVK